MARLERITSTCAVRLGLALAMLAGADAMAQNAHPPSEGEIRRFGLQLDVSAPDGGGVLALFRPLWWLRLNGGLAYNVLGVGFRGGLSLLPVKSNVTPSLSLNLGHYFNGDLGKFVTPNSAAERALLSNAAYDFWSAQAGLEFGSQQGVLFYLRAGIAHLSGGLSAQDLTAYLNSTGTSGYRAGNGEFSALIPSFSLGIIAYIF
jgi:hypothetical protein